MHFVGEGKEQAKIKGELERNDTTILSAALDLLPERQQEVSH